VRVRHIGHLLWEQLGDGDVEAVAADVEEGAIVAKAVLEAVEVIVDTIDGAEPQDEA
jgi:hypothetical protein